MKRLITALAAAALLAISLPLTAQTDRGPELDPKLDYFAKVETGTGEIVLKLYDDKTPQTVKNFVNLAEGTGQFRDPKTYRWVKRPYYDGLSFHRVTPGFMIQSGDAKGDGNGDPGYMIRDEVVEGLTFDRPGLLAMVNKGSANTGGCQFFVTESAAAWLDGKHTIFGEVLEGTPSIDTVKAISAAATIRDDNDRPKDPVALKKITIHKLESGISPADAVKAIKNGKGVSKPAPEKKDEKAEKPKK